MESISQSKVCSRCKTEYPLTSEFWHKNRSTKNGYGCECKSCVKFRSSDYRKRNRDKVLEATKKWKRDNAEKVREYNQQWRKDNPENKKMHDKKYGKKHAEKLKIKRREYYEDHKKEIIEKTKKYLNEHPETRRKIRQNYRHRNPELAIEQVSRRRARKLNASGSYTAQDARNIYNFQNGHCKYCGANLEETGKHLDHIIPLSRGGSNWPTNLQYLCPHCNCTKHNKMPWELDIFIDAYFRKNTP